MAPQHPTSTGDDQGIFSDVRQGALPQAHRITVQLPCIIGAECWPSWLYACQRYSFTALRVYAPQLSTAVKASLTTLHPTCQWVPDILPEWTNAAYVLLQGSTSFLNTCFRSVLLTRVAAILCCDESPRPPPPPSSWCYRQFNPTHFGGVVDGCWQLQSTGQLPLDLPLPHAPLRGLRLKHFLDDTVRGGATSRLRQVSRFCPTRTCYPGHTPFRP